MHGSSLMLRTTHSTSSAQNHHASHKSCYGSQLQNKNDSFKTLGQGKVDKTAPVPCMLPGVVIVTDEGIANFVEDDNMTFDNIRLAKDDEPC